MSALNRGVRRIDPIFDAIVTHIRATPTPAADNERERVLVEWDYGDIWIEAGMTLTFPLNIESPTMRGSLGTLQGVATGTGWVRAMCATHLNVFCVTECRIDLYPEREEP